MKNQKKSLKGSLIAYTYLAPVLIIAITFNFYLLSHLRSVFILNTIFILIKYLRLDLAILVIFLLILIFTKPS